MLKVYDEVESNRMNVRIRPNDLIGQSNIIKTQWQLL
ncbi:hypothetical protein WFA24289_01686 [Periweissella fabaria]|uniref:Uncharacterized protein n=1 Tax=Periweissella fabaria TaxID=546157 RepID=A0ABM8Z9G7_9LACO|nr:hypothetical protein WFA24289_01686 [Periweissella fabaria]